MQPDGENTGLLDYAFSSPSMAAAVVLGESANGRIDWKDGSGQTLEGSQECGL